MIDPFGQFLLSDLMWEPQTARTPWHSRASGGAVHSIRSGPSLALEIENRPTPRKPRRFGWKVLSLGSLVIGVAVHFFYRGTGLARRRWHDRSAPPRGTSPKSRSETFFTADQALVGQGRALGRKPSASQSAKSSEHLRPPNAPTISETQAMPNPKSIML